MASKTVVLLLVVAAFTATQAQLGAVYGPQAYHPGSAATAAFAGRGFQQGLYQEPQLLTCIGRNEALDQLRITLRPEPRPYGSTPAFQYGRTKELERMDWRISAVYIPAASQNIVSPAGTSSLVGTFFLGVTRYGRTSGSCAGLGGILQNDDLVEAGRSARGAGPIGHPLLSNPFLRSRYGLGGLGGLGGIGGHSPAGFGGFGGALGGLGSLGGFYGPQHRVIPPGHIQDPIVITQGGNVYSGVIRNLAEIDLRGRGIAVCLDAECKRTTTTCCTLAKDVVPATENVGLGAQPIGPLTGSILQGGAAGIGGLGGAGIGGFGGNAGIIGGGGVLIDTEASITNGGIGNGGIDFAL